MNYVVYHAFRVLIRNNKYLDPLTSCNWAWCSIELPARITNYEWNATCQLSMTLYLINGTWRYKLTTDKDTEGISQYPQPVQTIAVFSGCHDTYHVYLDTQYTNRDGIPNVLIEFAMGNWRIYSICEIHNICNCMGYYEYYKIIKKTYKNHHTHDPPPHHHNQNHHHRCHYLHMWHPRYAYYCNS